MDEIMKQQETPVPVGTDAPEAEPENDDANVSVTAEKPKQYSLKSARTALKRMETDLERKTEQVEVLKKEITALKPEIRSMKALVKQLQQEETERKMRDAFRMKSKHMTEDQLMKALDIVQELDGDLDDIDIDVVTKIIRAEAGRKRELAAQPADAGSSNQTETQDTEE